MGHAKTPTELIFWGSLLPAMFCIYYYWFLGEKWGTPLKSTFLEISDNSPAWPSFAGEEYWLLGM